MGLVGRIPPRTCWDYIDKIAKNPQKEILVLRFGPANNDEVAAYNSFFTYLSTRDRFGVVGNARAIVKDCYILPLAATQPVPAALEALLEGPGLPAGRPDLLLSILVRARRHRPGDPPAPPALPAPAPRKGLPGPPAPAPAPLLEGDSPYSPPGEDSPLQLGCGLILPILPYKYSTTTVTLYTSSTTVTLEIG
jgi:hypothetical protein